MIYALAEKELLPEEVVSNDAEQEPPDESDAPLSPKQLMDRIREAYPKDERLQRIINAKKAEERKIPADLRKDYPLKLGDCKVNDDLLLVNDKIAIPEDDLLRTNVVKMHHDGPVAEHPGRTGTFANVSQHYWWPRMTDSVKLYVRSCLACSYSKTFRQQKQGLLKPLPIPDRYWQDIACDFVTNLPPCRSGGRLYRHILVVVDRLSKTKKFIPMNSISTEAVVQAFLDYV